MTVVDASVVLHWLIASPCSLSALRVLERGTLTAPDIMPAEVRDALDRAAREGIAPAGLSEDFGRLMPTLALDLTPTLHHLTRAFQMSMILSQPIFSCVYLAVAEAMHARLATADSGFAAAVRQSPRIAVPVDLVWDHAG